LVIDLRYPKIVLRFFVNRAPVWYSCYRRNKSYLFSTRRRSLSVVMLADSTSCRYHKPLV